MKKCLACNNDIPITIWIDGKKRNLSKRKYCFECSPFQAHNVKKLHKDTKRLADHSGQLCVCKICGKEFVFRPKAAMRLDECQSCISLNSRRNKKNKLLEFWGSKCVICGYDTYAGALDFHHLNPDDKSFQLSVAEIGLVSYDRMIEESEKCILLCSNCHRELHGGLISIAYVEIMAQ